MVRTLDGKDPSPYGLLISHDVIDEEVRRLASLRCYGGRELTRPDGLALVARAGVPVMPWALASDRDEVLALFDRWEASRILLKKSGTYKGKGICAFDRSSLDRLSWEPSFDIFCPDLCEDTGDSYKAELFNGRIVVAWMGLNLPLRQGFDGFRSGIRGAAGKRRRYRFAAPVRDALCGLSAALTRRGIGYCSLEMMKSGGELVAIEINVAKVATWWTGRFPQTRWRYARAVRALVDELSQSPEASR